MVESTHNEDEDEDEGEDEGEGNDQDEAFQHTGVRSTHTGKHTTVELVEGDGRVALSMILMILILICVRVVGVLFSFWLGVFVCCPAWIFEPPTPIHRLKSIDHHFHYRPSHHLYQYLYP